MAHLYLIIFQGGVLTMCQGSDPLAEVDSEVNKKVPTLFIHMPKPMTQCRVWHRKKSAVWYLNGLPDHDMYRKSQHSQQHTIYIHLVTI